jgi:hypothetical protein
MDFLQTIKTPLSPSSQHLFSTHKSMVLLASLLMPYLESNTNLQYNSHDEEDEKVNETNNSNADIEESIFSPPFVSSNRNEESKNVS